MRKYGKATFADAVNNKYPIDTPGRIKAAWAYIHQPVNAGKYSDAEVRTIKSRIRRAAKARNVALPDPDEFLDLMDREEEAEVGTSPRRHQRRGKDEGNRRPRFHHHIPRCRL